MSSAQLKPFVIFTMILLFSTLTQAQTPNYDSLWQEVETLEDKGLPKSALKVVERIAHTAIKHSNHPQVIKTMLYKSKYALTLEEDAQLKIINDFKTEISTSEFPTKNVLESILANLYWQYFQQNRWKFYNRTKTVTKVDPEDFRTWDLQTLFNEVHKHFQKSLENGLLLQQEPLKNFAALLHEQEGSKIYRPTLFDFLCHNALEFYTTNETHIAKPAYKFEIENPSFLADAKTFSELNISSKDSSSGHLHALKIYKSLIRFHLKDASPFALTEVNIERLKFVNQHAQIDNKNTLLLNTLELEREALKNHETSGLYDFEIATLYYEQSKTYIPKKETEYRWEAKRALEICKRVIANFPDSRAAKKCNILKLQITRESLQITAEAYLPVQTPSRILLRYKNLNTVLFKAYKISEKQFETFNTIHRQDEQWAFIKSLNPVKSWESKLKNEDDYQKHTTEIVVPKFNNGRYLIVATTSEKSDINFSFAHLQVTNMALVESETKDHKIFQIINRNNGEPIANATVELSYFKRNNANKQTENYTSDELGQIHLKKLSNGWYRNINLKVTHTNEVAYFGDYYLHQHYKTQDTKTQYNSFLFTDRSIYRPGQTVYFKGIVIERNTLTSAIIPDLEIQVVLRDANNQEIKTMPFTTNEFGSFSGEFIIPNNVLNGIFSIYLSSKKLPIHGYESISVEEYKRPKFETKFTPIKNSFRINDSVTIQGKALAYAGSNITDAKVVYRVQRKVQFPGWYYWYRPNFNTEAQEIAHGETRTDDAGNFEISFKALPDHGVDRSNLPVFKYEVTADVTDINGETRSATTVVNIGYHTLNASLRIENRLDKSKKNHQLHIKTQNLNGEFIPAKGTVKIFKLRAPYQVLRERPWAAPDYQEISKDTFKTLFPHEAYENEHDPNHWEKGTLVFQKSFDTQVSKTIELEKIKKWDSGLYLITLETKDKFGQVVKDKTRTTLYSDKDDTVADLQLFDMSTDKPSYNVGDIAHITISSAAKNIAVTITIEKNNNIIQKEVLTLSDNKKVIRVPVTENDFGGFAIRYSFAAFNSFQSGTTIISVPYPKTDLEIETLTFRDKLKPGTDETWQFKIKGPKGNQVSAELLASMYDASLDQFKPHQWRFNPIQQPNYYAFGNINAQHSFGTQHFRVYQERFSHSFTPQSFDRLNWFGFYFGYVNYMRKARTIRISGIQMVENTMEAEEDVAFVQAAPSQVDEEIVDANLRNETPEARDSIKQEDSLKSTNDFNNIKIRKNLQETAFFFPQLNTDKEGNVSFSFTSPEALTQWKLQLLAHTKSLESTTSTYTAITQKELMVIPNAPRFLRHGDQIHISTKIANLTENTLSGHAKLMLTDAISGEDITENLVNSNVTESFSVAKESNTQVSWVLNIPDTVQAVQYKIIANSGEFSDGEQNALPVLSNRMLVTETLPMWVKTNETRTFSLDKLKTNTSTTLKHHKLTLEITSNPAWYAVQALPYLMEFPYDCNEQTFSRYYANALASHIANSNPRIQDVFNQWKNIDALLSNLEKNETLKSVVIQETPWLRDAQSETEQKKRIALLFDLNKMKNELQSALLKLKNSQMHSGAWSWFKGGYENRFITQHIITGFGHLYKLGVIPKETEAAMIKKAIHYLDTQFIKEYHDIRKYNANIDLNKDHLSYTQLHYLYMRSFFTDIETTDEVDEIMAYYHSQIQKYWLKRSLYAKGLMALISHGNNDTKTANKLLNSLKETSITSEELGMYWKTNTNSWHWFQAPIETQALLIEAFSEIENNTETIDNLKIWLLKNKQTNQWKTTKATTEAVYALLLQGSDWLSVTNMVDVVLSGQNISPSTLDDVKVEAGTGYYKTSWNSSEVNPEMGEVQLSKKGKGIAWGSLYWQYFEDLDKITSADTPLKLNKKLFVKRNTDKGEEISEITNNTQLKVGDLIRVRIELRSDRNMEFLHMKDMRAAGLEPVNVISQYKWQDGLGYYESTKDASTNFFFDVLPKGVYVFEYDLRVNNAGEMSNGTTTIQSMYAPEFSSHSEGTRIEVK